jgi:hypothetical protein
MKRKTYLHGFRKHQSEERLTNLNRAWRCLTPAQKLWIYLRALWHSCPTLHQVINQIKYNYLRWITYRFYPAHWVK